MRNLAKLSIAAKLNIFALLAMATLAPAGVAVVNSRQRWWRAR